MTLTGDPRYHWAEVVGERVRRLRVLNGWSQNELARLLRENGYLVSSVSRITYLERPVVLGESKRLRRTVVTADLLMHLAKVFEVPVTTFLRELESER
jgi:transcriptional regulator with XRE-family HTH domain